LTETLVLSAPPVDPVLIDAELAIKQAQADKIRAEADEAKAKARLASCRARIAEMDLDNDEEAWKAARHSDHFFKTYRFIGNVDPESVGACIAQLTFWHRTCTDPKTCPIEMTFTSDGGDMIFGMALYDTICDLRDKGHVITTKALGVAASMACILLQAGSIRQIGKQSSLLIHETSFGAKGKTGEVEDALGWVKERNDQILDIFAERSRGKVTKAVLRRKCQRRDWWISADESLRLGLVDEIC
jgi:ATP-dependent protease ClpP protease subunit